MSSAKVVQRSDLPTMLLHWGLVITLVASATTGWRVAGMTDHSVVMRWLDALLIQGNVVRWHFFSAATLAALVVAYVVFLWRMGLSGRLTLRLASLRSSDARARWSAINKLIYWVAFALLGAAAVTGTLLYFFAGAVPTEPLITVHRYLSWSFVAYIAIHVLAQIALGGMRQLLKIVSPRLAYGMGAALALSAGAAAAALAYVADASNLPKLIVRSTDAAPTLDGDVSEAVWAAAPEVVVHTSRGFNLDGGEGDVHVKALRDATHAYFVFRWRDATYSQKHTPVVKTEGGWKVMQTSYFINDENDFYEDKFAVMIAASPIAGGNAVRIGPKPLDDRPGPANKLGLHVTSDGSLADVWHWKSVRTGATNQFDDNHFGPPLPEKKGRYTGGYTQDPKTGGGFDQNFVAIEGSPFVKLKVLPRDLQAQLARQGKLEPDPNVGDHGSYWMAKADTVLASVVVDKAMEGDRGDVTVYSRWKDGWWTLEASRKLDTGSKFDQPLADGMFMWVSVFDHNQVRHTRHVQPLRITMQ